MELAEKRCATQKRIFLRGSLCSNTLGINMRTEVHGQQQRVSEHASLQALFQCMSSIFLDHAGSNHVNLGICCHRSLVAVLSIVEMHCVNERLPDLQCGCQRSQVSPKAGLFPQQAGWLGRAMKHHPPVCTQSTARKAYEITSQQLHRTNAKKLAPRDSTKPSQVVSPTCVKASPEVT